MRKEPAKMSKDELLAEVYRLEAVIGRWKKDWHSIIEANEQAYKDEIIRLKERCDMLERLI